mgnify:CR=1 FL=1
MVTHRDTPGGIFPRGNAERRSKEPRRCLASPRTIQARTLQVLRPLDAKLFGKREQVRDAAPEAVLETV